LIKEPRGKRKNVFDVFEGRDEGKARNPIFRGLDVVATARGKIRKWPAGPTNQLADERMHYLSARFSSPARDLPRVTGLFGHGGISLRIVLY